MFDVDLSAISRGWEKDSLIFSYSCQKQPANSGMTIILHQQETSFSLTMHLTENEEALNITRFTLAENSSLEQQSLSLYDAATVEIVLQALDLLFIIADHADVSEIAFVISKDETMHLSAFACFFDADFILQTSPQDYDAFVNKTEILKTTVRHELWQRQWHDRYLRDYLQNRQKGYVFPEVNIMSTQPQPSNIIAFPL